MDSSTEQPKRSLVGFWSLFVTQFQGAFNDNAFKFIVIFMVLGKATADNWAPLVGFVFAVPFILFSAFAGQLATKFSKRIVTVGTKVAEVVIMILAILGFVLDSDVLLVVVVFLLSSQSAFFGPSKYGLLPELLPGLLDLQVLLLRVLLGEPLQRLVFFFLPKLGLLVEQWVMEWLYFRLQLLVHMNIGNWLLQDQQELQ